MRESQQAHLLSQYVESLKHNPDAIPPAELDDEMAIFARTLVESQNHRRARVWSQVLAEVKHDSTAGGRLHQSVSYEEPTTVNDPTVMSVFNEYRTPHFPQTQKKRQTFPLTLIAATLVLILGIAVMIAIRSLPEGGDKTPYAAQIGVEQAKTGTPIPTSVPTVTAVVTPFASIELGALNAGRLEDEAIEIINHGSTLNLSGWTLRDLYGNVYHFPERQLLPNEMLTVHSSDGTDRNGHIYWNLDEALFNNRQNTVVLANEEGNIAVTVAVDTRHLLSTSVPTMTPPQLCNVQSREGDMNVFSAGSTDSSTLQLGTLPEDTIAQVFEQMQDERQNIWYHIRADIGDARIIGWVNANNVVEVGERCPTLLNNAIVVTAIPDGTSDQVFIPTGAEDLTELLSAYDYLPVVIAGLDIPEGTQITENMLVVVYMPVATVQDMVSRNGTVISGMNTFRNGVHFSTEAISRWQPLFMSQIAEEGGN